MMTTALFTMNYTQFLPEESQLRMLSHMYMNLYVMEKDL